MHKDSVFWSMTSIMFHPPDSKSLLHSAQWKLGAKIMEENMVASDPGCFAHGKTRPVKSLDDLPQILEQLLVSSLASHTLLGSHVRSSFLRRFHADPIV